MKKFLFALLATTLLVVGTSTIAYAWWTADARINASSSQVEAAVRNNLPRPIYCRGNVYGETASGHVLNAWMEGTIYPGRFGYVYVYTNDPYNPFVRGWANIRCQTR